MNKHKTQPNPNQSRMYSNKSSKNMRQSKKTSFCKVCYDAGKSEAEYTSHFVRSAPTGNSVITCPLLLAQKCRYCDQSGHTVKYCKVLRRKQVEERNNMRSQEEQERKQEPVMPKEKSFACKNAFDLLDISSDEEKPQPSIMESGPRPLTREELEQRKVVMSGLSWSAIASLPKPEKQKEKVTLPPAFVAYVEKRKPKPQPEYVGNSTIKYSRWADDDSSSDDDDEN